MRSVLTRGPIRLSGIDKQHSIGLIDEPILPQQGGTHSVVFVPFGSKIGTTTLVQRLCGANPSSPNPSSGINGYRAVWSISLDQIGSIRYENLFLWDVCYETQETCASMVDMYLQTAKVVVLVIPASRRNLIQQAIFWYQSKAQDSHRVIVAITQSDIVETAQIRPTDIENLSATLNASVIQISSAHITPDDKHGLHPTIRNLVLSIIDNLPERV